MAGKRSSRRNVTVFRTKLSGRFCGDTTIVVLELKRSGSVRAQIAVPAAISAVGSRTNHTRLRAMRRTSSGVYVLPGSIGSPSTLNQRFPGVQRHAHAVPVQLFVEP